MAVETMRDLIKLELEMVYGAEDELDQMIPDLLEEDIESTGLRSDLEAIQLTSRRNMQRLQEAFSDLHEKPDQTGMIAEAMSAMITKVASWDKAEYVRDAGLIGALQCYLHYLIASYGTLRSHARTMGMTEPAAIFEQCLQDVSQLDELLTRRAQGEINERAAAEAVTH